MRIAVVGLGHIGLPLAVQYASRGHDVTASTSTRGSSRPSTAGVAARRRAGPRRSRPAPGGRRAPAATTWADPSGVREPRRGGGHRPRRGRRGARDRLRADRRRHARHRARASERRLVVYETTLPVGTTRNRFGPVLTRAGASSWTAISSSPSARSGCSRPRLPRPPALPEGRRWPERGVQRERSSSTARPRRGDRSGWSPPETAELTKLAETTYRDVNIAYANELARFAARSGLDVTEAIGAANSQPYSHIH